MVVKDAFVRLFKGVRAHPFAAVLLLVVTAAFFVALAYVAVKYSAAMAENLSYLIGRVENANYDEEAIKAGQPFLSSIADVLANYQAFFLNLLKLVLYQVGAFFLIGLLGWSLVHYVYAKSNVLKAWWILALRALVFVVPMLLTGYMLLDSALSSAMENEFSSSLPLYAALALIGIGYYFLLVCLALPPAQFSGSISSAFVVGAKKIHYLLTTLVLGWGLVIGSFYLVSLLSDRSLWLLGPSILLFFVVMTLAQMIFVAVVYEFAHRHISTNKLPSP